MRNILVFCLRDWLHPQAGPMEHYVHQVLKRISDAGYSVSLVCQRHPRQALRKRRPQTEMVDGIQLARLGPGFLYRKMAAMFLSAVAKKSGKLRYDVIIDCVHGHPLNLAPITKLPVVPLVFDLHPKVVAADSPPGPVIAATAQARGQLLDSGMPQKFIVTAPYGGRDLPDAGLADTPSLVVAGPVCRALQSAIRSLRRKGVNFDIVRWPMASAREIAGAWAGYCGRGWEPFAVEFASAGLPVLMANGGGGEFIMEGETGYRVSSARALAHHLGRLASDGPLRARMSAAARQFSETRSWDRTAGLVLATIENLQREVDLTRPRRVHPRQQVRV